MSVGKASIKRALGTTAADSIKEEKKVEAVKAENKAPAAKKPASKAAPKAAPKAAKPVAKKPTEKKPVAVKSAPVVKPLAPKTSFSFGEDLPYYLL